MSTNYRDTKKGNAVVDGVKYKAVACEFCTSCAFRVNDTCAVGYSLSCSPTGRQSSSFKIKESVVYIKKEKQDEATS
jgi:hypothetical protein